MHYDMKHMGVIIQEARIAHGMTQSALAEKIDISLRTVIAIETGKRNPTFEVLYKIIRELNIPADLDIISIYFLPYDTPTLSFLQLIFSKNKEAKHGSQKHDNN